MPSLLLLCCRFESAELVLRLGQPDAARVQRLVFSAERVLESIIILARAPAVDGEVVGGAIRPVPQLGPRESWRALEQPDPIAVGTVRPLERSLMRELHVIRPYDPVHPTNLARGRGHADAVHCKEFFQLAPHIRPIADRSRGGGEALQHRDPIPFRYDSPVQEYYRAHIRFGANQSAEPLFQLERGERHEVMREAIDARLRETLQPGGS